MTRCSLYFALVCLYGCLLHASPASAAMPNEGEVHTFAILGGYGQSEPGWGLTEERVQIVDIIPRYNHVIFDELGSGWWRGFHSVLVEVPFSLVLYPDESAMVGVNFLAAYTFSAARTWRPYIFGGGGPVYSFAEIPGMGAELNGNYQFGLGLEQMVDSKRNLLFEVRYHHLSNAGAEEPNVPLNSWKLLMGMVF